MLLVFVNRVLKYVKLEFPVVIELGGAICEARIFLIYV